MLPVAQLVRASGYEPTEQKNPSLFSGVAYRGKSLFCWPPELYRRGTEDVPKIDRESCVYQATLQASLRTIAGEGAQLADLVARLNRYACAHSQDGQRFITALLSKYDPEMRRLTYVNAGSVDEVVGATSQPTTSLTSSFAANKYAGCLTSQGQTISRGFTLRIVPSIRKRRCYSCLK